MIKLRQNVVVGDNVYNRLRSTRKLCCHGNQRMGGGSGMNYIDVKVEFEKCEWSRESDDVWRSDCGLLWEFDNEETPKANNMNYCPQCGKILEEAPECWEDAE